MTQYLELNKAVSSSICPKTLGFRHINRSKLEQRIRELMSLAVKSQNRELAQVACDITADEIGSGDLLSDMDLQLRSIESDIPEHEQIEQAYRLARIR